MYVVTPDLPSFIKNIFVKLPKSTRIILVTGSEDIGIPYEIFNPDRLDNMVSLSRYLYFIP